MLEYIVEFLDKWQTLISGVLALFAALITIRAIHRQINLSEGHERRRREVSEDAARAVLPLTLSAISEYVQQSSDKLHTLYNNSEEGFIPEKNRAIEFPPVPESAISSLQSMIEASTNREVVKVISKIIRRIQIHDSRTRSLVHHEQVGHSGYAMLVTVKNIVTVKDIEEHAIGSAIIHTLAESLFAYARFKSETPEEVSWNRVECSLLLLNWDNHIHTGLYESVATRKARSALIE
jgi:hypothetical protein